MLRGLFFFSFLFSSLSWANILPNAKYLEFQRLMELRLRYSPVNATPTDGDHVQFPTAESGLAWVKEQSEMFKGAFDAKTFTPLELSDPRYTVLNEYVRELWQGFTEIFPQQTAGLGVPPVVLVDSEVVNAFVPQYQPPGKVAHIIVVLTGFIDAIGGIEQRDAITGMFGHELAHSVFRHILPKYQSKIDKFFRPAQFRLGYRAPRDAALEVPMKKWLSGAKAAGDLTFSELRNLPSQGLAQPMYGKLWKEIKSALFEKSPACEVAEKSLSTWLAFSPLAKLESAFLVHPADLPSLDESSNTLIRDEVACLNGKKKPFLELFAKALGVPVETLQGSAELKEVAAAFDGAANPIEGLRFLVGKDRAEMVEVEKALDLSKLGHYTYEEHADEVSLLVMRHLGRDPQALDGFFKPILVKDGLAEACEAVLATGAQAAPGAFSDPHRAVCYRIGHLRELGAYLDSLQLTTAAFVPQFLAESTAE